MNKIKYEKFNVQNIDFFERSSNSLIDPLGIKISKDIKWIQLKDNWNFSKSPVVVGGEGNPILLLHGFDSSFLEFRRVYPSLKKKF